MNIPKLGVGITYSSEFAAIAESHPDLVTILEVEPQTFWIHTGSEANPYRVDTESMDRLRQLPQAKLLHGIGFPVGGSVPPDRRHIAPFQNSIETLNAQWVSEHLSFNEAGRPGARFKTGFMLPPRQTAAGADYAVESIRSVKSSLTVPFAVETGVNYLRPRRDELPDGEWIGRVIEAADCGLVLDIHNLWTNQLNGRQSVLEFLEQIPPERVWEIHIAGGFEHKGYWLDSHSGAISGDLLKLTGTVLPRYHNLGAVIFELFSAYLAKVGEQTVVAQLEDLRRLWDGRSHARGSKSAVDATARVARGDDVVDTGPTPVEWEDALGAVVAGKRPESALANELAEDPGIGIITELLAEFRSSMVVGILRLTSRLLMLSIGDSGFKALLQEYWNTHTPEIFASDEARGFASLLRSRLPDHPYLHDVLAYETAALNTIITGVGEAVRFSHDPLAILRPLSEGRLPENPAPGNYEVEITPDADMLEGVTNAYHGHS